MQVGIAGLGRMGVRMAANLAAAGLNVCVWNRTAGPAQDFASAHNAFSAANPKDLAERSDVVITMLADDAAAEAVYLGPDGLLEASGGSRVLAEMGTISVPMAERLALSAREKGRRFVDAPVSGATQAAADAKLLIMAGAEATDVPDLARLFEVLGRKTVWLGKSGAGAAMKLGVNMLIHGLNQTLAEALTLTTAAGIPKEQAYEVVENSAAAAPVLAYRKGLYLDETAHDVSFTVALARKDVGLALELASTCGVIMPQAELNHAVLKAAGSAGYDDRDMASILSFVNKGLK
ncbi:NAD-binding protein [Roseibium aggregatum]|uniref:NAD(P)-dependent oxidoreductase n=1 Tax=Roseibium aggregatum TaxID=187304 RepID=UPI001E2C6349|nr:NAD(P)-dependent oxidoreductase [Roseibium aggregatum]UES45911.1 NAD-binding protein [Roseibium aggregatum]UES56685.1 NAD-binding protein [Roseibium aggregatum]